MKIDNVRVTKYTSYLFLIILMFLALFQLYTIAVLKFNDKTEQPGTLENIDIGEVQVHEEFTGDFYLSFVMPASLKSVCHENCEFSVVQRVEEKPEYIAEPVICADECKLRIINDLLNTENKTVNIEARVLDGGNITRLFLSQELHL